MLKYTVGSIVVLLSPLSASSLSKLLHFLREDINRTFEDLHATLDILKDPTRQLRLHHPSFRDFLLSKDRCGNFWVDKKEAHQILATGCIQLMSQTLKKDVCEMHAPGSQASQVVSSRIQKCLPLEVQYACLDSAPAKPDHVSSHVHVTVVSSKGPTCDKWSGYPLGSKQFSGILLLACLQPL